MLRKRAFYFSAYRPTLRAFILAFGCGNPLVEGGDTRDCVVVALATPMLCAIAYGTRRELSEARR